jgi:hypothetical protein
MGTQVQDCRIDVVNLKTDASIATTLQLSSVIPTAMRLACGSTRLRRRAALSSTSSPHQTQ